MWQKVGEPEELDGVGLVQWWRKEKFWKIVWKKYKRATVRSGGRTFDGPVEWGWVWSWRWMEEDWLYTKVQWQGSY